MDTAAELEHLRARVAALDCSLGLILISVRDRHAIWEQPTRKQRLDCVTYLIAKLEEIRHALTRPPAPELVLKERA